MIAPQLLALYASKCAVGEFFLCQAIVRYMNRKPAAHIPEHRDAFNRLASRPKAELLEAISR
jgi:hypothetical protein